MKSVYRILIFLLCILSSLTVYAEDIFMGEIRDIPTLPDSYPEAPEGFLPVCHRRSTSDLVVAITIDDCNQPGNLSEMIRIISGVGGHATIFPIGENVSMLTGILRNAVDAGYELGNHTMTHSGLYWEDDEGLAYQIWQQDHEIDLALGYDYRVRFMRPRGGDNRYDQRTHAYLRQLGYSGIAYWSQVGSGNTAANLMANLHTGDIILFHTTNQDLQVIRELVPMLYRKGYRLVTLSELFCLPENQRFDLDATETPIPVMPYVRFEQDIVKGDYLHDVYLIQERLAELGYLTCEYNGYFGASTESALKKFQADMGLTADGVCDSSTWNALFAN